MFLQHHGILGQKWGDRNGPPYPLRGGQYSKIERKAITKKRLMPNSIYNKKHFDEVIEKDKDTFSTVSHDKNRTSDTDMFFAAHYKLDKHLYNGFFNKEAPRTLYDDEGNEIGTGMFYKYRIDNALKKDMKVASEDSGADAFIELWNKDRDFYNFVMDKGRMESYVDNKRWGIKGYRESREVLNNMRKSPDNVNSDDLNSVYRLFNYVIPYDGGGTDKRGAHDITVQRAKFFNSLKNKGYGAVLDTNDAIYNSMKARSPVIVFDMENVVPQEAYQTTAKDVSKSRTVSVIRKILNHNLIKV